MLFGAVWEPFDVPSAQPAEVVGQRLLDRTRPLLGFKRGDLDLLARSERPGGRYVVWEWGMARRLSVVASLRILRSGPGARVAGEYRTGGVTWALVALCAGVFAVAVAVGVLSLVDEPRPGAFAMWVLYGIVRGMLEGQRLWKPALREFVRDLAA